jgi:hypothetical protein
LQAKLKVTGRDIEEAELGLEFKSSSGGWTLLGDAHETLMSQARFEIRECLSVHGASTPMDVAKRTQKNVSTVRGLLQKMLEDGQVYRNRTQKLYSVDAMDAMDAIDSMDDVDGSVHASTASTVSGGQAQTATCPDGLPHVPNNPIPGNSPKCMRCGRTL